MKHSRHKHKRKTKHILLVASDSVQAGVRQYLYKPGFLWILIMLLCVALSGLTAYVFAERNIWTAINERNDEQIKRIEQLEDDKQMLKETIGTKEAEINSLNSEIENLNQQIRLLSDTVNEKVQRETELTAEIESQSIPTMFPLTGSASMTEDEEDGNPIVKFQAASGSTVVATASGTVSSVTDDPAYGHCVTVDHGNGYVTVYRNKGDTNLKIGESVVRGTTLFLITKDNMTVGYQIKKDETYIDPISMMAIDG